MSRFYLLFYETAMHGEYRYRLPSIGAVSDWSNTPSQGTVCFRTKDARVVDAGQTATLKQWWH